jgi:hypothetical protein
MSGREPRAPIDERSPHVTAADRVLSPEEAPIDPQPASWRNWLFGFAQRMFLLIGLYVLSIGPMYWHWYGGRFAGGSQLVAAFYEPIFIMATLVPWFGEWMDWYVGLWIA